MFRDIGVQKEDFPINSEEISAYDKTRHTSLTTIFSMRALSIDKGFHEAGILIIICFPIYLEHHLQACLQGFHVPDKWGNKLKAVISVLQNGRLQITFNLKLVVSHFRSIKCCNFSVCVCYTNEHIMVASN